MVPIQHPSPCLNFPTVKCIRSTAEYFAERLYKAMKVSGSVDYPFSRGSLCHRVLLEDMVMQDHEDRTCNLGFPSKELFLQTQGWVQI